MNKEINKKQIVRGWVNHPNHGRVWCVIYEGISKEFLGDGTLISEKVFIK